jgi:hypothetical protein
MEISKININNNTPIDMARNFIPMDQRAPAKIFNKNESKKNKKEEENFFCHIAHLLIIIQSLNPFFPSF